jgi:23S rRNA (adenine2030-N6)-methyltransferase
MNYRHAYHAGNFADVLKHIVFALIIEHLKLKSTPFRIIDTHAGIGLYDLSSDEAVKTGEWRDGIGRLMGKGALPDQIAHMLAPYVNAVAAVNHGKALRYYPGSPRLALELMRPGDKLIANELHPEDAAVLTDELRADRRAKVLQLDAWIALKSLLPPKERRGLVLIDPPFEAVDEFDQLVRGLREALRRFESGIYQLWYPIKDPQRVDQFRDHLIAAGHGKMLSAELFVGGAQARESLSGCGLLVVNPPYTLPDQLKVLSRCLPELLSRGTGAAMRVKWLNASTAS